MAPLSLSAVFIVLGLTGFNALHSGGIGGGKRNTESRLDSIESAILHMEHLLQSKIELIQRLVSPGAPECYFDNWPLNMAHDKTTYASSSASNIHRTVDGDRAEYDKKCMNTKHQMNPWLVVDLNQMVPVSTIVLTANTEHRATTQYKILVGDTFDADTFDPVTSGYVPCRPGAVEMTEFEVLYVHCQKTLVGRYVLIFTQDDSTRLRLCEVEVYKEQVFQPEKWTCIRPELQGPKGLLNIARGRHATQSSESHDGRASKAVDGNDKPIFQPTRSCTQTLKTPIPWWQVDLGQKYLITGVAITNRVDCCPERLSNFTILVGNNEGNKFDESDYKVCALMCETHPSGRKYFTCDPPLQGNHVAIAHRVNNYLTLCEVEVYTDNLNDVTFNVNTDLGRVTIPNQQCLYDDDDMTCLTGGQVFPTGDTTPRYIHIPWDPTSRTGMADRTASYYCKNDFYVNTTHTADMNTKVVIHDLAGNYQTDCTVVGETDRLGMVWSRYACSCAQKCDVIIVVYYPGDTKLAHSRLCTVNVYD